MAQIPEPARNAHEPLSSEVVKSVLTTGEWQPDPAVQLVVQDAERAERFLLTKQWIAQWPTAAALYQSPYVPKFWEGTQVERSNVPSYMLATVVNSLVPQVMNGIFYEDPPFMAEERPGTSAQASRAVKEVLSYELGEINFRQELGRGVFNTLLFGTGIWKWGWDTHTKKRKIYKRAEPTKIVKGTGGQDIPIEEDEPELITETIEETVNLPHFEHIVDNKFVMVSPTLNVPDIRKSKYVIHRLYLTFDDLEKLRDIPGYDIPSKAEMISWFTTPEEQTIVGAAEMSVQSPIWDMRAEPRYNQTTIDPSEQVLEVLERWDNDKCMAVLQRKKCILNDENPYGVIPFLSVGWWDVPGAFFSIGLAKSVGSLQRMEQGTTNAWMDDVALKLQGVYVRVKGRNAPTQNIRISPGKIIDLEKIEDFQPLKHTEAVPEGLQALQIFSARAEQISGANELTTQGSLSGGGRSSITRTATGSNLLASGSGARIQEFVEKLSDQVIIPFLYSAHELNAGLMPYSTLKYILDKELQVAYQGDVVDIMNARVKFTLSAAARLQARRNMAQALPILIQFLESAQTQQALQIEGKKVDINEVLRMLFEVSDWKNIRDVIVPMTPEDQQRMMQLNPGVQKAAAQSKAIEQKHQNDLDIINEENTARAGREVLRQAIEQSATPFELTGESSGKSEFGSPNG